MGSPKKQQTRGQATVLVGMMVLTFLLLFQFVVNTGLLVNAKISLQNAADMAAYAGAATQARQLNQIAFLNYEMRARYKQFLFQYYVIGGMAQDSHNTDPKGGRRSWRPAFNQPTSYGAPVVCVMFNPNDNYCHLASLAPIPVNKVRVVPILDSIGAALKSQFQALERIRQQSCEFIGSTNGILTQLWLYNTDPDLTIVKGALQQSAGGGPEAARKAIALQSVTGLASGLGLIPRLALFTQRINTLNYYVNFDPQTNVNFQRARDLEGQGDIAARERTLQAFYSAYYSLGEHTFNEPDIFLDEFLPPGNNGANALKLDPIQTDFEVYFVEYPNVKNVGATTDPKNCEGSPTLVQVPTTTLGFKKDPKVMTYYAVRLRAKANLMFSPFGREVELTAYAAARPFGSRIGPPLEGTDFISPGRKPSTPGVNCGSCTGIPNLPVEKGGSVSKGWDMVDVVRAMYGNFQALGGGQSKILGATEMGRAYQAAKVPNPWERGKYSVPFEMDAAPNDPFHLTTGDPFMNYFNASLLHAFWAPVVSSDQLKGGDPTAAIAESIREAFPGPQQAKQGLVSGLNKYLGDLRVSQGEDGEGFNLVTLRDHFRTQPTAGGPTSPVQMPDSIMMTQASDIKTSWADVNRADMKKRGRIGYSVKFISFQNLLTKNGVTTDGTTKWENDLQMDAEMQNDIQFLKH